MDNYERKLDHFADGKELMRLAKPLRDHADASCDACGSTQPRTLFCLKDIGTVRYFFVGDNCLKELLKRGVIKRRFGKEATPIAYQEEMARRSRDSSNDQDNSERRGNNVETSNAPADGSAPPVVAASASEASPSTHRAEVYVIETNGEYHAFVSIKATDDPKCYWGYGMEYRYESTLRRGGEGGLRLDWVKSERPHAVERSLSKAMEEAYSRFEASRHLPLIDGLPDMEEFRETTEYPRPHVFTPTSIIST